MKRKNYIAFFGELALEDAIDLVMMMTTMIFLLMTTY